MEDLDWPDIQQCCAGDNEVCARLFQRHEAEVARQMWRFSRDPMVCEELVHEVFVEVYLSLARYRPQKVPFVHWLRRIATRVGYRFWKQQARRRKHVPLEGFDKSVAPQNLNDPVAAAALLHSVLARLPAADRLILTLMYFEGCKLEEVAQRTGWSLMTLKMRAYRARNRLKEIIEREKLLEQLQELSHGSP